MLAVILPAACPAPAAEPKPLDIYSPEVKQYVLASLRDPTSEEVRQFRELVQAIVDGQARQRDRALRQFLRNLPSYGAWPVLSRHGPDLAPQHAERFEKLFEEGKPHEAMLTCDRARRLAGSKRLMDQPDYLIRLLAEAKGPDRPAVAARLQQVTGQSLGDKVRDWRKWWAQQKVWGKFHQVSPEVAGLLRFRKEGKSLRLGRDHWAEVAKNINKKRLAKEFEALTYKSTRNREFAAQKGKKAVTGPDFRLVFKRLQLATGPVAGGGGSTGKTVTLGFSGAGLNGTFCRRGEDIDITLEETLAPRRRLQVSEAGSGALRIMLSSLTDGSVLLIQQDRNGRFAAGHADVDGTANVREDTFESFCQKRRRYADEHLFQRLRQLGVGLPPLPASPDAPAKPPRAAALPEDSGKAHWKNGQLQEIPDDVGRLIGLTVSSRGLCLDRGHWGRELKRCDLRQLRERLAKVAPHRFDEVWLRDWPKERAKLAKEAAMAFSLLQLAARQRWYRGGGGGGSSFGGSRMNLEFSIADEFAAGISIRDDQIGITIAEKRHPRRQIGIADDGSGPLRILVTGPGDQAVLLINQAANGRFAVAEARGETLFVAAESSFKTFSRKHSRYLSRRLFGYLKHLGFATPPDIYHEAVIDAVLLRLTGPSEQNLRQGRRLIKQLDHAQYRKRQEATSILTDRFGRYRKVLEQARKGASLSPEANARLDRIFTGALPVERVEQVIAGMGLTGDAAYLTELLARLDAARRQPVAARLRALTDKD